jgi:ppGpp synthetase/RelA/SpoT-type nucleotidyltranferase
LDINFDEEKHRQNAISAYSAIRRKYEAYGIALESLLKAILKGISTHQISARAKDIESFANKACTQLDGNPLVLKYPNPCTDIEDLCAARVIVYTLSDLERVKEAIARQFKLSPEGWDDKGARLVERQTVGYRSLHSVVQLDSTRNSLPEYQDFDGLKAEIQVRTVLQHAWAEIEHDIRYKSDLEPHKELFQRFAALAGLIEIGDREFEEIVKINNLRRKKVRELAQLEEEVPIPVSDAGLSEVALQEVSDEAAPLIESLDQFQQENSQFPTSPKDLIGARKYSEAIAAYSRLIDDLPQQITHRVGRAKARFLNGDSRGALEDLDAAELIKQDYPAVARLRSLITGVVEPRIIGTNPDKSDPQIGSNIPKLDLAEAKTNDQFHSNSFIYTGGDYVSPGSLNYSGHMHIANGEAELALIDYEAAELNGFSPVFTTFNRAIAFALKSNFVFAMHLLGRLKPFPNSILELHHSALAAICLVLSDQREAVDLLPKISRIKLFLEDEINYSYDKSVMLFANKGLKKTLSPIQYQRIEPFFLILGAKNE